MFLNWKKIRKNLRKTGYVALILVILFSYTVPSAYVFAQSDTSAQEIADTTSSTSSVSSQDSQTTSQDSDSDGQSDVQSLSESAEGNVGDVQGQSSGSEADDQDGPPDLNQVLDEVTQIQNSLPVIDTSQLVQDKITEIQQEQAADDEENSQSTSGDSGSDSASDTSQDSAGGSDLQSTASDQNNQTDTGSTDKMSGSAESSGDENKDSGSASQDPATTGGDAGISDEVGAFSIPDPEIDPGILEFVNNPPRNRDEAQNLVDEFRDRIDEREVRTDNVSQTGSTTSTSSDDYIPPEPDPTTISDVNLEDADDTTAVSDAENTDSTAVETNNNLVQENITEGEAVSGENTLESGKDILEGSIYTGNSNIQGEGKAQGNTTSVSTGGGSTGWIQRTYGAGAQNSVAGDDNQTASNAKEVKELTIVNKNKAFLSNVQDLLAKSGDNTISAKSKFKEGGIFTGNSVVKASFLNLINTNTVDSEFLPINIDIYDPLTGNINILELLFEAFGAALDANGVVSSTADADLSGDDNIQSTSSTLIDRVNVENNNEGYIYNDLKLTGISGSNKLLAGYKAKQFKINTGDVQVLANLINFLNTNLFKSKIGVITLNVYTDWAGSLILPTAQKLAQEVPDPAGVDAGTAIDANNVDDTISSALAIANSDLDVVSVQQGEIKTKINIAANSGENTASFGKKAGNIDIKTGKVKTLTNVLTLANKDIIGLAFSQGFFNILGEWTGTVAGLSDKAVVKGKAKNFVISDVDSAFSGRPSGVVEASAQMNNASDSVQLTQARMDRSTRLRNFNDGTIINKIDVLADSGRNDVSAYKGKDGEIETGNVKVGLNLANFLNNNFAFSKGLIVAVNVFGKWRGNIAYDEIKDLSVDVTSLTNKKDLKRGDEVRYQIEVLNSGTKPTEAGEVVYRYDANRFDLVDAGGGQVSGNSIVWSFPAMQAGERTLFTVRLRVKDNLPRGHYVVDNYAELRGVSDENNKNNNDLDKFSFNLEGYTDPADSNSDDNPGQNPTGDLGNGGGDAQALGDGNNASGGSGSDPSSDNGNTPPAGGGYTEGYLIVSKTVSSYGPWKVGDEIMYTIQVTNPGDSVVNDVVVYDNLRGQGVESPASWPIQDVLPGETVTIEYGITVVENMPEGEYTNTAYASGFDAANAVVRSQDANTTVYIATGTQVAGNGGGDTSSETEDNIASAQGNGDSDDGSGGSVVDDTDNSEDTIEAVDGFNQEAKPSIEIVRSPLKNIDEDEAPQNSVSEDVLDEVAEDYSKQMKENVKISRYVPVARAAENSESRDSLEGQVRGASSVADLRENTRVAYSIYPNFLYFDGMNENPTVDEIGIMDRVFAAVRYNLLWLVFIAGILFTAYIGYREKKRREMEESMS